MLSGVVDNVPLCPNYRQQYQQQSLTSAPETAGYSGSIQPLQNQAYAAQPQYYSSHCQVMHGALQACHPHQRHSPMLSQFQQPVPASSVATGDYSASWQQHVTSVNYAGDNGTRNYRSQFCGFANQRHAVLGENLQHRDDSMKLNRQHDGSFRATDGMQRGFARGCQQMPSSMGVIQNRHINPDGEVHMSDMSQTMGTRADRRRMMCNVLQQQDVPVDHQQQTAGFAGQRPQQFVAAPRQHSVGMNSQTTTITDAFSGYHNPSVMQPSRAFTVQQQQQQASWEEPACCQSYMQTGCYAILTPFYSEILALDADTGDWHL